MQSAVNLCISIDVLVLLLRIYQITAVFSVAKMFTIMARRCLIIALELTIKIREIVETDAVGNVQNGVVGINQ